MMDGLNIFKKFMALDIKIKIFYYCTQYVLHLMNRVYHH